MNEVQVTTIATFSLSFEGGNADYHQLDFYDAAEALIGFQRSLAITTHLVLNGDVITQAPALKNARILIRAPEAGSWKVSAMIVAGATAISQINAVPKESPLGNMIYSAYDYVISETLGFHVDYSKTLGVQYEEYRRAHPEAPKLDESRLDSVIEKCEHAVRQMHRPIVNSNTAEKALITLASRRAIEPIPALSPETYEYMNYTATSDRPIQVKGRISSYNINTFKGRIFCFARNRPIAFTLYESARTRKAIAMITKSLTANAESPLSGIGDLTLTAFVETSRSGTVKRYQVLSIDAIT